MTYRQTFVIEYANRDQAPAVAADMELLGGKLVAVQFGDALEEAESQDPTVEMSLLRAVALGEIRHIYQGDCPDESDRTRRDSKCPACRVLGGAQA